MISGMTATPTFLTFLGSAHGFFDRRRRLDREMRHGRNIEEALEGFFGSEVSDDVFTFFVFSSCSTEMRRTQLLFAIIMKANFVK